MFACGRKTFDAGACAGSGRGEGLRLVRVTTGLVKMDCKEAKSSERMSLGDLPNGLEDLHDYLSRMIEIRRTIAETDRAGGTEEMDLSRLLDLESECLIRVADTAAGSIEGVMHKLAIWALIAEDHDDGESAENAVVRSALVDLRRLVGVPFGASD
jgi:hypothetical protein